MSDRERLFFALVPPQEACHRLFQFAKEIAVSRGGRIIPQQNLHLTLRFLGSVDLAKRACVEEVASTIDLGPFELDFVLLKQVRHMIWAVAPEFASALSLAEQLQAIDRGCNLPAADHSFAAHITLIRDAKRKVEDLPILADPVRCRFDEFCLMRSQTLPQGSRYTVVRSWPLKKKAAL